MTSQPHSCSNKLGRAQEVWWWTDVECNAFSISSLKKWNVPAGQVCAKPRADFVRQAALLQYVTQTEAFLQRFVRVLASEGVQTLDFCDVLASYTLEVFRIAIGV